MITWVNQWIFIKLGMCIDIVESGLSDEVKDLFFDQLRAVSQGFSHVLWLKVHNHLLLIACLLSSKRKLPPQACQVPPGLPSVVCHPRGLHFPGTMYICSHGLFSSALAHCISCAPSACSHCRRCCCCPLQYDRCKLA